MTQNVVSKIDGATGEVTVNPETVYKAQGDERLICQASTVARTGPPAPTARGNTMYMPLQNMCMTTVVITDKQDVNGPLYGINNKARLADGTDKVGVVQAISAETGQTVWKHEQRAGTLSSSSPPVASSLSATRKAISALDDKTGKAVGGEPRHVGERLPDHIRRERQTIRRREHWPVARRRRGDGADPELKPGSGSQMFVFALP